MSSNQQNQISLAGSTNESVQVGKVGPRLRIIIFILSIITILGIAAWQMPRALSLYYQTKGGQLIASVLMMNNNKFSAGIPCAQDPLTIDDPNRIQISRAVNNLDKAFSYYQNSAQTYLLLGRAYCLLGEEDKAISAYMKYTDRMPENPLGHLELGFAYEAAGDQESAGIEWKKNSSIGIDFVNNGDSAFRQNDFTEAIKWYTRASIVEPDNATIYINTAKSFIELSDLDKALDSIQIAWKMNPELSTSFYSQLLIRQGDHQASEEILQEALTRFTDSSYRLDWWQSLGKDFETQKNWEDAVQVYANAVKEFSDNADLHISLGWALYEQDGDIRSAQREFVNAITETPDSGKGYYALGQLLNRDGNAGEAEIWLQRAVEKEPKNPWYRLVLGNTIRSEGSLDRAIKIYEDIIAEYPSYDLGYLEVALAYDMADRTNEAIASIERALTLAASPDQWYYTRAGFIYEHAGDREEALKYYHQALGINPKNSSALEGIERLDK